MHGESGPEQGIVIGRLTATSERFIANTPDNVDMLAELEGSEGVGRSGSVHQEGGCNIFVLS